MNINKKLQSIMPITPFRGLVYHTKVSLRSQSFTDINKKLQSITPITLFKGRLYHTQISLQSQSFMNINRKFPSIMHITLFKGRLQFGISCCVCKLLRISAKSFNQLRISHYSEVGYSLVYHVVFAKFFQYQPKALIYGYYAYHTIQK